MALNDGGFIFGGDTGLTYEQLKQRRAIAAALAQRQKGPPKNVGEGLTYLGDSFAEAMQTLALNRAEAASRKASAGYNQNAPANPYTSGTSEPQYKPVPRADVPIEPQKPTVVVPPASSPSLPSISSDVVPSGMDMETSIPGFADASNVGSPVDVGDIGGDFGGGSTAAVETTPPPDVVSPNEQLALSDPDKASSSPEVAALSKPPAATGDPLAPIAPLPGTQANLTPNQIMAEGEKTLAAPPTADALALRDKITAQLVGGNKPTTGDIVAEGPTQPPAQSAVTLPTQTADIPLPRGNPRTTGGVQATMDAVFSREGYTPQAIEGIKRNVNDESRFNYTLRHPDQPRFSGEAHYAHGLYQEGGDEWNNFVRWVDAKHPGSDWRDPHLQSQYVAERLKDPQYARTFDRLNTADNSGQAADAFLRGYLKPADQYLQQRSAAYLNGRGSDFGGNRPISVASGDGTPVQGNRAGDRVGGAPQSDDTRDMLTLALLEQNQRQSTPSTQGSTQAPAEDDQQQRLRDVAGLLRRPALPQRPTASLGRTGIGSDVGIQPLDPMGALPGAEGGAMPSTVAPIDIEPPAPRVVTPQQSPTITDITPAPAPVTPGLQTAQAAAPAPAQAPVGARQVEPPPVNAQGQRTIPPDQPYPDIGPRPTMQSVMTPQLQRFLDYHRQAASNPMLPESDRAAAREQYNNTLTMLHQDLGRLQTSWDSQNAERVKYGLGSGKRGLENEGAVLANEKARRELEGEGFLPISPEEQKRIFPGGLPNGVTVYQNRRGELKTIVGPQQLTIDQKGESAFSQTAGKIMAEFHGDLFKDGNQAAVDLSILSELRKRGAVIGTGASAVVRQRLGDYGIKTEGLDDVQAFTALINKLTPQQRVAGSGPTSDFDARMFRDSLPRLINQPGGNELIIDTMSKLAENRMARAEISGQVLNGVISPQEGNRRLLELQAQARMFSDEVRAKIEGERKGERSPEDSRALDWANQNPNDPRSREIKRRLGVP